jgi:3',5'-cyclic AMP phosphodiesterase CpdA
MRLVHLTDPHLSSLDGEGFSSLRGKRWSGYLSWRKNRSKRYLPAVLNRMVELIKSENADQILLTGDLIQIGLATEIAEASEWLTTLGPAGQVMLVPGNHDIYARGSAEIVQHVWSEYMFPADRADQADQPETGWRSNEFPVLVKRGNISFIGLTSACVTPVFMASGKLGEQQLGKLDELLKQAAAQGQLVCLSIHHPPLPGMTKWRKALTDADALQAVLEAHPPLLIFHGHLHHNRELQWGDSRIYCTAAASSASDASYRVFNIEETEYSWVFQMTLKSISIESGLAPGFAVVDEQRWEISKEPLIYSERSRL